MYSWYHMVYAIQALLLWWIHKCVSQQMCIRKLCIWRPTCTPFCKIKVQFIGFYGFPRRHTTSKYVHVNEFHLNQIFVPTEQMSTKTNCVKNILLISPQNLCLCCIPHQRMWKRMNESCVEYFTKVISACWSLQLRVERYDFAKAPPTRWTKKTILGCMAAKLNVKVKIIQEVYK